MRDFFWLEEPITAEIVQHGDQLPVGAMRIENTLLVDPTRPVHIDAGGVVPISLDDDVFLRAKRLDVSHLQRYKRCRIDSIYHVC